MPFYVNPPWADTVTTTRDNRSVEHGSLFTNADPSKGGHESPVHPVIPQRKERPNNFKGIGKYPVMRSKRPKNW